MSLTGTALPAILVTLATRVAPFVSLFPRAVRTHIIYSRRQFRLTTTPNIRHHLAPRCMVTAGTLCVYIYIWPYVKEVLTRAQVVCESRGGRPGLPVLMSLTVSVDVKQH